MKINRTNYEDFLIQKLEGLLSTEQNAELDLFLHRNADIKSEWEAFEQTKLVADESIVYGHKELLLKKQSAGVIPMYRTMLFVASIAASLLLVFFVSQKYLFNTNTVTPVLVASVVSPKSSVVSPESSLNNNQSSFNSSQSSSTVTPKKNLFASNYHPSNNINQQTSSPQLLTSNLLSDIQPMKTLSPKAMNYYPRVSYASFIWTKGLKTPHAPVRNVSEAGAWLQVASILGAEVMRLTGRGERVNKAPLELQLKKPLELNINNPYMRFHKLISFKKNNKNNK